MNPTNSANTRINNYYSKPGVPPILSIGKDPQKRSLCMFVSNDMPNLQNAVKQLMRANHPTTNADTAVSYAERQRLTDIRVKENLAVHSQICWTEGPNESSFGFTVQLTNASRLLLKETMDSIEEPTLFPDGYKILYMVEGSGAGIRNEFANAGRQRPSTTCMCIASGETELYKQVRKLMEEIYPGQNTVEMMPLNSGDVTWVHRARNNVTGEEELWQCNFVIERKKNSDFVKTITDDRKLQLAVMLDTAPSADHIMYIIEGDVMCVHSGVNGKARVGSVVYPIFRNGIRVAQVQDTAATAAFLVNLHLQMEYCKSEKLEEYTNKHMIFGNILNHTPKKADYTGDGGRDEFIRDLVVINGMSDDKAIAITEKYPSILSLITAYIDIGTYSNEDPNCLLQDIVVPGKTTEKAHRLGPALSARVCSHFRVEGIRKYVYDNFVPKNPAPSEKKRVRLIDDDDDNATIGDPDSDPDLDLDHDPIQDDDDNDDGYSPFKSKKRIRRKKTKTVTVTKDAIDDIDDIEDSDDDLFGPGPCITNDHNNNNAGTGTTLGTGTKPKKKSLIREPREKKPGPVFARARTNAELRIKQQIQDARPKK